MTHLFFIDESGNDGQMPYEIHGGIIVPLDRAWDLIQVVKGAQTRLFGAAWSEFEVELKGERLLQKRIFKFARGGANPPSYSSDEERRSCAHSFMEKGYQELLAHRRGEPLSLPRTARAFRAYGLACLDLVDEVFLACQRHHAYIFATAVDPHAPRPPAPPMERDAAQRLGVPL
jgi:hypothetical protein